MPSLYIAPLTPGAGSTMLASGVTRSLRASGRQAQYWKPLAAAADADAAFCEGALGPGACAGKPLGSPASPGSGLQDLTEPVRRLVGQASQPLVIDGIPASSDSAKASSELATLAGADVVLCVRYQRGTDLATALAAKDFFRGRLKGIVLNAVPEQSRRAATEDAVPAFEKAGIKVLSIIPEDRVLLGFSVADYSARLGGKFMNHQELGGRIVENILVGANSLDPGELYYERIPNKALITRGDRPDLQFSALNTSTRCLILTQGVEPIPYILDHAAAQEVPVVVVPGSTMATVSAIEGFIARPSFHHSDKLARAAELVAAHADRLLQGV